MIAQFNVCGSPGVNFRNQSAGASGTLWSISEESANRTRGGDFSTLSHAFGVST